MQKIIEKIQSGHQPGDASLRDLAGPRPLRRVVIAGSSIRDSVVFAFPVAAG
jgi:hypothetical protein